jgi:hypothetical protein
MEEKDLSRALSGNPLGVASLIVSILGFAMSLFALSSSVIHHSSRIADSKRIASKRYEGGDPTVLTDKIGIGISYFSQTVLYVASILVGGTLSLVGFALGIAGVTIEPKSAAMVALVLSLVGPLLLLFCLVFF